LGFSKPEVLRQLPDWSKETPYAIRGDAVREAQKALVSGIKKYKRTGEIFNLRFKSKKEPKQSIPIQIQNVRKSSLYPTLLGSLKTAEPIKGEAGGRIVWENGRWFYTEPRSVSILQSDNQRLESVSIDPGVRTFATLFSPELAGKVGAGASSRIYRLCLHLDSLYSKISVSKGKRKYSLKKAAERLRWKIKDIITELHTKLGVWLCKTFKVIFLPTFGVQQMTSRITRKISTKSVRQMLGLAHYKFKVRLKALAQKYGSQVFDTNEAYTSKTCSACGKIHNIGSNKIMSCSCGNIMDRDINGARGIFLRALRDNSTT
jgi:putative transposase